MKEILLEEVPDLSVTTSSEVLPELFEHERFSTTMISAVLSPLIGKYTDHLHNGMSREGYRGDVLLLHSGGGVMTSEMASSFAARLAASGPAAGAIASRHIAGEVGFENAISLDMGGTSADVALTVDGQLRTTKQWSVEFGYPICYPSVEVVTVGAGGGSTAWLDEVGALHNGPQSAGAQPGPAAYGAGGEEPTTTDANLILGRLGGQLVGGDMRLNLSLATNAVQEKIARPLELDVERAAESIIEVANANMADVVRLVSIRRGYDPRDFCLVAMGGAGPLHGVAVARDLAIPSVLVPPNPGITSAIGCLFVDFRHDFTAMFIADTDEVTTKELDSALSSLERQGRAQLNKENVPREQQQFIRTIDMRYRGQWRSVSVTMEQTVNSMEEVLAKFYDEYERAHSFRQENTPVELYRLGVAAIGVRPKPSAIGEPSDQAVTRPTVWREVVFSSSEGPVNTPVFDRARLATGTEIEGPAVIEQLDSTVLIPPMAHAQIDEKLNILIEVGS